MRQTCLLLESDRNLIKGFRTGVSLHSHTLCSRETLSFIYRLASKHRYVQIGLIRGEARYRRANGTTLDLSRAWWTPPSAPRDAWELEANQIESNYGLRALVSLSDHDDIEAPLSLRVLEQCKNVPISVEWTVPFGPTFFHLGVHNLPPEDARNLLGRFIEFTKHRRAADLSELLASLHARRDILVVFNHPLWDENGIGQQQHVQWATHFLEEYRSFIHALELNGLRPWLENREAFRMARDFGKPLVGGGDRHALEPNTILDLSNASNFSEYVEQVRSGSTTILLTHQYREPLALRILQNLTDIMAYHENHGRGWRSWSDRVFYRCDDGVIRSMTDLFSHHTPAAVQLFVAGVNVIRNRSILQTCRVAFPRRQELAL